MFCSSSVSERYPRKDSFRLNPFLLLLKFMGGRSLFSCSFFFDFFFFLLCVLQLKRKSYRSISVMSAIKVASPEQKERRREKRLKPRISDKQMRQDAILRYFMFSTVFVNTRLWKTKYPRKRFQNFRQSYVSLTDRIEIYQSQPDSMT